jgi:CheY-like chemotaxis protein
MARIRLIHWNVSEAETRAQRLEQYGHNVDRNRFDLEVMRELRDEPADAVVIDLSRLPAQGRDLGVQLRRQKSTRFIPQIFVAGVPEKVERVRALLPDATYTDWDDIAAALTFVLRHPVTAPVVPGSVFEAYKDVPLSDKLGLKPNLVVTLIDAPENFTELLTPMPKGIKIQQVLHQPSDLCIWFVTSRSTLEARLAEIANSMGTRGLWVVWPKKTSKIKSDLTQVVVRKVGLTRGLVDYKVAAIDKTWTGLRLTRQKSR